MSKLKFPRNGCKIRITAFSMAGLVTAEINGCYIFRGISRPNCCSDNTNGKTACSLLKWNSLGVTVRRVSCLSILAKNALADFICELFATLAWARQWWLRCRVLARVSSKLPHNVAKQEQLKQYSDQSLDNLPNGHLSATLEKKCLV